MTYAPRGLASVRRLAPALLLAMLLALLAFGSSGCFNPFAPRISTERVASTQAPIPNSPTNIIKLFEWCWNNRDPLRYQEVFTDDYRFLFAAGDSAGVPYRDTPYTREDEMYNVGEGLFVGNADHLAAKSISLQLDKTMIALPDPRPGKDPLYHKSIRTQVHLQVEIDRGGGNIEANRIEGSALFFVVRGDSAVIPPELIARGFTPDAGRWWIERWEDETLPATSGGSPEQAAELRARRLGALVLLPPQQISIGRLKALYY